MPETKTPIPASSDASPERAAGSPAAEVDLVTAHSLAKELNRSPQGVNKLLKRLKTPVYLEHGNVCFYLRPVAEAAAAQMQMRGAKSSES